MNSPLPEILLFSSGLDSFITWRLLGELPCLYVRLNHRYQENELFAINRLWNELIRYEFLLQVEHVDNFDLGKWEDETGHIPGRNLQLALAGALHANTVYMGALRGESSSDKSGDFFDQTSGLLSLILDRRISLVAPYRHFTKTRLLREYLKYYGAFEDLRFLSLTYSCYNLEPRDLGTYAGCGRCMACFRRWVAFTNNKLSEKYQRNPWEWDVIQPRAHKLPVWWQRLKGVRLSEWPGIFQNNLDAARALYIQSHIT